MSLHLPHRPNLDLLKRQAKSALRVGRLLFPSWRLADAQRALARGYGVATWTDLKRSVVVQRRLTASPAAGATGPTPELDTQAPKVPRGFIGAWLSRIAERDRVAMEIAAVGGALQLTQVFVGVDGGATANSLLLRIDGRDHQLPVGDRLLVRARWLDERTLHTTVTRDGQTVGESSYVLSEDGHTLCVDAATRRLVFGRVTAHRAPAEASGSRALSRTIRAGVVAMMVVHGACAAVTTRGGLTQHDRQSGADIEAIEALNRHDVAATLASDVDAILSQWTDDFVVLPPAGEIIRGKAANVAMITAAREQLETFEPIAYDVTFEEIVVTGDYAFAWGRFRAAARTGVGGSDLVSNGKLLRIYQRQPDGRWLMHRTMSTMDPARQ